MHEYRDTIDHLFYVRIETGVIDHVKKLKEKLHCVLPDDATVEFRSLPEKKVIVLVTKEYHCLADILIRNQFKTLGASVQCVIGNHAVLQNICDRFEIPFHLVSHEKQDRISFENQLLRTINQYDADYLVLANLCVFYLRNLPAGSLFA
jgi:formyltetrahydrofolate deformylase